MIKGYPIFITLLIINIVLEIVSLIMKQGELNMEGTEEIRKEQYQEA